MLQLTTHVGLDTRLEVALEELAAESLVPGKYCRCAKVAFAHVGHDAACRARRRQADAETWQLVAEACGAASWDELLAEHDAARQSIADLWNRIKQEA